MATAHSTYLGSLRCENVHLQSGTQILTDAPTDSSARRRRSASSRSASSSAALAASAASRSSSAFSPTDLCALSLTTCIITTMGIYAQGKGLEILEASGETTKHMASDPRCIAAIDVRITLRLGAGQDGNSQEVLRRVAHTCPVARSLHPDIEQRVELHFLN